MKITKKNGLIALVLVAAIALMSFGFAAWQTTLTLEGTVASEATWDIQITELSVSDLSCATVEGESVAADGKSAELGTVTFGEPLAWVEYTVTVKNAGTLGATLTTETFDFVSEGSGFTAEIVDFSTETLAADATCVFTIVVVANDIQGEDELDATGSISLELVYDQISGVEEAPEAAHTAH